MTFDPSLAAYRARLPILPNLRWQGRVTQITGSLIESQGPFASVGEICQIIDSRGHTLPGEVVGFRGNTVLSMPLDIPKGVRFGDRVVSWGERATLRTGNEMLGRVIDGTGQPLDSRGPYR